jgi:diacylglycerol kinase (ATP)
MRSSIVLIFNPTAKRASERKIIRASHFLESKRYKVKVLFTEQKGDAESLAREAIKESPSLIIAAGGDGTFNEVVNGITGSEIPMAILPLGTTNVLAKELGIPETVEGAIKIAVSRTPKTISLGKISITRHSSLITRYFLLMAGIGFDGEAVFRINETLKKISGKGAYFFSGFKILSVFSPNELILDMDGRTYTGYSAIIGKAAKYGGNFKITPDARLTDRFLYACLFKGRGRLDILRYVLGVVRRRHLRFRDVEYVKTTCVDVKGDAHIQIDGDYFGKTPARIEGVPDIVRMVF